MAKDIYVGVDGKARRVKAIYVGVDGKARKVTSGYVGVGGKAKQFFSGGVDPGFEYTGTWEKSTNAVWNGLTIDGKSAKVYMLTTDGRLTTTRDARVWGLGGGASGSAGSPTIALYDAFSNGPWTMSGNGGGSGYFEEEALPTGNYDVTIGKGGIGVENEFGVQGSRGLYGHDGGETTVTKVSGSSLILTAKGGKCTGDGGSGGGGTYHWSSTAKEACVPGGKGSGKRLTAFEKNIHDAFPNWYCGGGGGAFSWAEMVTMYGLSSGWDGYDGASDTNPGNWPFDESVHDNVGHSDTSNGGGFGGYPDGLAGGGCGGAAYGDWIEGERGKPGQDATGYGNGGGGGSGGEQGCGKGGNGYQGVVLIAVKDP